MNVQDIASEIFTVLQSFDYTVMLYDNDGNRVEEPADAFRFFARPANLMISLKDDEDDSGITMFIGKSTDVNAILGLITTLRNTCSKYNILFNVKKYGKEINPKDFSTNQSISEAVNMIADRILNGMSQRSGR